MTLPNSSSINAYGSGVLVDAVPLVDPTSEMGAAALNPLRNDVAAMTNTAPRCIFQFQAVGGIASVLLLSSPTWIAGNDSVWGNAPAVQPQITKVNSSGTYTVQLPSTVSDQIGNNNLTNVRCATIHQIGTNLTVPSFPDSAMCIVTSSSTFTMQLYRLSGGAWAQNDCSSTDWIVTVY